MYCDLHGHSRKMDVFIYGCEKDGRKDWESMRAGPHGPLPGSHGGRPDVPTRHQDKLLPLLVHYNLPDIFSFRYCNFKVSKGKFGTGRVVGWRELGLVNAFTLEASFAGASGGRWARQHFHTGHLEAMGAALCYSLLDYWDDERCVRLYMMRLRL